MVHILNLSNSYYIFLGVYRKMARGGFTEQELEALNKNK